MALKAVIWDFGGVFTASPFEAFNAYEAAHGLPRNFIRAVNATDPHTSAWAQFESARIGAVEFDALFHAESAARGHPVPGAEVLPLLSGEFRPRMIEALKACKRRFKVACITNNMAQGNGPGMATGAAGAARGAEVMALFDVVIESSKVGVRKPLPAIYLMACEALAVAPADCLYLDDLGVNCKAAALLGMRAIKVTSEAQALADLAEATEIELLAETGA